MIFHYAVDEHLTACGLKVKKYLRVVYYKEQATCADCLLRLSKEETVEERVNRERAAHVRKLAEDVSEFCKTSKPPLYPKNTIADLIQRLKE